MRVLIIVKWILFLWNSSAGSLLENAIFQKLPATNPPPQPTITKSEDPLALEAPLFFIAIAGGASTVPRSERDHTTLAEYINR